MEPQEKNGPWRSILQHYADIWRLLIQPCLCQYPTGPKNNVLFTWYSVVQVYTWKKMCRTIYICNEATDP